MEMEKEKSLKEKVDQVGELQKYELDSPDLLTYTGSIAG